jgi:hypothetical protein
MVGSCIGTNDASSDREVMVRCLLERLLPSIHEATGTQIAVHELVKI